MTTKNLIVMLAFLVLAMPLFAQTDLGFNYQAVARDNNGSILANTSVNVRFRIKETSLTGPIIYQEVHTPTTNNFGLVNVVIGEGAVELGTFGAVDWASGEHFLVVELNGTRMDSSKFEAVPYSKVATDMNLEDLKNVNGSPSLGQALKWDGSAWIPSLDSVLDDDGDPTNELQSLVLIGNDLSISSGNTVTLPTGTASYSAGAGIDITGNVISNTGDTDSTDDLTTTTLFGTDVSGTFSNLNVVGISGEPISQSLTPMPGQILKYSLTNEWVYTFDDTNDADSNPTNEIQSLSLSGNQLTISAGNTVTLPTGPTYTAGTGINITGNVISATGLGIGSTAGGDLGGFYPNPLVAGIQGNPVSSSAPSNGEVLKWNGASWAPAADNNTDFDSDPTNELQTLSISGNTLTISNGNAISVPGSLWSASGNNIYYTAGNVAIGTTSALYPLTVGAGDDVVFGSELGTTGSKFFYDSSLGALRTGRTNSGIVVPDSLGLYSFASGYEPIAEGSYSAALNFQSRAYGNLSFAAGLRTYSDTYGQFTVGRYNSRSTGSQSSWSSNDPVFVVGNGSSNFARNDAFTVLKAGRIGVNDPTPEYLFDVENDDLSTRGIYLDHNATATNAGSQYGLFVDMDKSYSVSNTTFAYGLYSDARNDGGYAYGLYALGTTLSSGIASAYGVRALANNDNGTGAAYGIYASLFTSTSTGVEYAGYFAGDVFATGSYLPSDVNLKKGINPSGSVLGKLLQLQISNYTYKTEQFPDMNLPQGTRTGFMAQDVAQLMPELVKKAVSPAATEKELEMGATQTEDVHFEAVDYAGMVPYLVKAIQEQQAQIEELKAEIKALKNKK